MKKTVPEKILIPAPPEENYSSNECPYMRLNTMEKLYLCMKNKAPKIEMDAALISSAIKPIEKMLEMS